MNPAIKLTDFGVYVMVNDTHLSRWVEQDRRLDHAHQYIDRFKHLIPLGGTVVDAGTCIGDHTCTYASIVGPEGRVLGFEANPDVAECCALNLSLYPNTTIYNVGLGADYGVAGIDISPNVGASKLKAEGREVKIEPLDAYADHVTRCDFIKVDIEGYEPAFLDGAKNFIGRYSPAILMEVNRGSLEAQGFTIESLFSKLKALGYSWLPVDKDYSKEQYDILATKRQ